LRRVRTFLILAGLVLIAAAAKPLDLFAASTGGITALGDGQILRGRFQQLRFLEGLPAPLKSAGSFTLVPGHGLIWRTETPFAVTTVMTPAGLVQAVNDREIVRMSANRLPFMSKLYAMLSGALSGDWDPLAASFKIERQDEARNWRLRLEPITRDDPAMPIRAITARGSRLLEQLEIVKANGDRDRLILLNQKLETASPRPEEIRLLDGAGQP
jgi:hypothetical protein